MNTPTRTFEESRRIPFAKAYIVTESGKVGRIGSTNYLKPCAMKRGGYLCVGLSENGVGKTHYVHQLVAKTFIGPRPTPKHDVAHNDGDKTNNHWRNLRWATRRENEADKLRHGRSNRGERNGQARLTDQQVRDIIAAVAAGQSQAAAAREYKLCVSHVWNIVHGRRRFAS